jgi:Ca2+-binding EF-hand superfamily protein
VRKAAPVAATQGPALKDQVERKLRASFDAADVDRTGTLTLAQARRAGLGVVANNFQLIDTDRSGRVSFDDLKRYFRRLGADI